MEPLPEIHRSIVRDTSIYRQGGVPSNKFCGYTSKLPKKIIALCLGSITLTFCAVAIGFLWGRFFFLSGHTSAALIFSSFFFLRLMIMGACTAPPRIKVSVFFYYFYYTWLILPFCQILKFYPSFYPEIFISATEYIRW